MFMALVFIGASLFVSIASADDDLQSAHYKLDESSIGNGGLIQSNSTNYQSTESIGDTAVGNSSSSDFQINAGSKTTPDPALAFGITSPNATFGNFSATTTSTATAAFSVSDYTSYGYAVQIVGDPPKNGNHTIAAMTSLGTSSPGTEQFGINLVANTSPTSFGANIDNGQFGHGVVEPAYNHPNQFLYSSGDTIAYAPKSSGVTTYTISYIVNVTPLTPGGAYTSQQSIICTGTF